MLDIDLGVTGIGHLLDYGQRDWLDPVVLTQHMKFPNPGVPHCVLQDVKAALPPASL